MASARYGQISRKTVPQKVYQECETWETLGDFGDKLDKHRKSIIYLFGPASETTIKTRRVF
jgi:hypothetical protein